MDNYLTVLVKRLRPEANEINAYRDDGQILGYARDASGALLDWPTMDELDAEWARLEAELIVQAAQAAKQAELKAKVRRLRSRSAAKRTGG